MNKKLLKLCFVALFIALTSVLSLFNSFVPGLPQGGTVSFDIIAIFLCAYFLGVKEGVICGVCVSFVQLITGMVAFYGPWSMLLDYTLPLAVCGLAPLVRIKSYNSVSIILGVTFSMILKFLSHFASGAFLFAEYAPEGMSPIVYSLGYNFYYNFATLVLCAIVVPILYHRLKGVFEKIAA